MDIVYTVDKLRKDLNRERLSGFKIGFVPTMGYLHEGHGALLERARKENDKVVLSVFVNPTQFNQSQDFLTYPRNLMRDQAFAQKYGVDYFFSPNVEEMYPFQGEMFKIVVGEFDNILCGRKRPGHFNGVALIVTKLLNIVIPDNVYFGQKDAQQVVVIKRMIDELLFSTNLHIVETYREEDNLAMSSRNVNLSQAERSDALVLYKTLMYTRSLFSSDVSIEEVLECGKNYFLANTEFAKLDYLEAYEFPSLELVKKESKQILIAIAAFYSKARLIDNLLLNKNSEKFNAEDDVVCE